MRLDLSTESLNIPRSESVTDLNSEPLGGLPLRSRSSFGKDPDATPLKPFGLGMYFLLIFVFNSVP